MQRRPTIVLVGFAVLTAELLAQAPAEHRAFEVGSIKQNKSGAFGPQAFSRLSSLAPGERVSFVNVPLRVLILAAYPGYTAMEGPESIGRPVRRATKCRLST